MHVGAGVSKRTLGDLWLAAHLGGIRGSEAPDRKCAFPSGKGSLLNNSLGTKILPKAPQLSTFRWWVCHPNRSQIHRTSKGARWDSSSQEISFCPWIPHSWIKNLQKNEGGHLSSRWTDLVTAEQRGSRKEIQRVGPELCTGSVLHV